MGEITKKVQERRLKWYGHVMRREEHYVGRRAMVMKVQGRRVFLFCFVSFDLAYYVFFDSSHWSMDIDIQFNSVYFQHTTTTTTCTFCAGKGADRRQCLWILFTILCGRSILAADDESVVVCGRDVMN